MSPRKRKASSSTPSDLQTAFDAINDITIRVKPRLADTNTTARGALIDDLQTLAALGQAFTEKRPRSNKNWVDLADALDREGVHLWNASSLIRQDPDSDDRKLFAALRLAGFRLIEAGLEQKPSVETLIHVLQLASKTGAVLSEIGMNDVASSVLGCAAKFEDQLRNADDSLNGVHDQAKARAITLYYCSRMQAASREGNDAIAQFMLQKITESDDRRLGLLPVHDRELLAVTILDIGKTILKCSSRGAGSGEPGSSDARKAHDAVKWIQRAFTLVEKMEDTATPGIAELKRGILRSLSRAYFLSSSVDAENLSRAETTLQELLASIVSSKDNANPEHQQLRWMRLAVLKRLKAPDAAMLEALESIVDHTAFTDADVTDVLQELRTFTHQHALVTVVLQRCLQRALDAPAQCGSIFVDRLLMSIIIHAAKDQDHVNSMRNVETACTCVTNAEFDLEKVPATACLTIIWQFGDRQYHVKKWSQAAEWFLAGTHQVFKCIAETSNSKCLRKAALCHIEQREYARASAIVRRCPDDQASTRYLTFLTAAYQGLEDEAIRAIEEMVKAPDFERKMLLLATQLAHEADMKTLLLTVLEALLKTVKTQCAVGTETEAVTLIRCIIRLVLRLMKQPDANQRILTANLIRHFRTAKSLVETAVVGKSAVLIIKDVSWLWRTAYNTAVQGCAEWENAEDQVADLFDSSYDLLQAYSKIAVANRDDEIDLHMVYASFAAITGRAFSLRRPVADGVDLGQQQLQILEGIRRFDRTVALNKDKPAVTDRINAQVHVVRVFEAELHSRRKDWDQLLTTINQIGPSSHSLKTFEAIADIIWVEQDCPVNILYTALEAILHATLDQGSLSVEKFSRWLRAICTILLSRNAQSDRTKAINYVEQALSVLEDHSENGTDNEVYPTDERYWLLSTAYNTGVECLAASFLDEAKRWFETATTLCRYVPDGKHRSEKVSETYRHLLDQYTHDSDNR